MATVTTEWQWIDLFKSVVKKNWNGIDLTLLNLSYYLKYLTVPLGVYLIKKKLHDFCKNISFCQMCPLSNAHILT